MRRTHLLRSLAAAAMLLASQTARADLLGYWTFDNSSYADSSSANHPAQAGPGAQAPAFSADVPIQFAGRPGAKSLDMTTAVGASCYAVVPGSGALYNPAGSFTVSCWVKGWPTASMVPFVSKNGEGSGWQVRRSGGGNEVDWTTRGTATGFTQGNGDFNSGAGKVAAAGTSAPGVRNTQWYHFVCTFDGTEKRIFINGQLISVESNPGATIQTSANLLVFGARDNGGINSFSQVKLDEVAIWNEALTTVQIADLFSGTDVRFVHSVATPWNLGEPWGTPGKWGVKQAKTSNAAWTLDNVSTSAGVAMNVAGATSQTFSVIDFKDPDNAGGGSATAATYLTDAPGDDSDFMMIATACIRVTTPGNYTFAFNGDDGFQATIFGVSWTKINASDGNAVISGETLTNQAQLPDTRTYAVANLPAGDYNFRYLWFERAGGAYNRIRISQGDKAGDDGSFKLLGDVTGPVTLVDQAPMLHGFVSDAYSVLSGVPAVPANITMTWDTKYAASVAITATPPGAAIPAISPGTGSVTIPSPAVTTTYRLTGTTGAQVRTRDLTVSVDQQPTISSFTLTDDTLVAGAPMTLNWNVVGATSLSINQGIGAVTPTGVGSLNLNAPGTTTTYEITAMNAFGTVTAQVTVTIGVPPVINSFTVNDTQVEVNQEVTFNYTTTGATTVTLSPNTSLTATPPGAGTVKERLSATNTYTLTASSALGQTSQQIVVNVATYIAISPANWTITLYKSAVNPVTNLAVAQDLISSPANRGNVTVGGISTPTPITITNQLVVNLTDNAAADGVFAGGTWPVANFGTAEIDDFVIRATATIVDSSPEEYIFNINNDDGGRLRIDFNNDGDFDDAGEAVIVDDVQNAPHTVSVPVNLGVGSFPVEYVYFERSGGAAGEVFITNAAAQNSLLTSGSSAPPITFSDLRINEFLASNQFGLRDGFGNREDWLEIYNGTGAAVSLGGYYLTDDPLFLGKWAFPTTPGHSLPNGGYLVVFASQKNTTLAGPEYHTNFKLSATGEYLALSKDNGMGGYVVVHQFSPTFPAQAADISYGEYDSEHYVGFFTTPSPGGRNGGGYDFVVVGETHVSVTEGGTPTSKGRGFFTNPIQVTITKDDPVATLRYTLDGSTPSISHGTDYTVPLNINSTTVLRSAAVREGALSSPVDTHTFIFASDVLTQSAATATALGWPAAPVNGQVFDYGMSPTVVSGNTAALIAALQAIPTLSIVTDIGNLVDPVTGIYTHAQSHGRIWERPASIELLNEDGLGGGQFQIDCGLRIRGGFSRDGNNPKHAWHLYFRNEYAGDLNYPIFGDEGAADFEQLDFQCPQNYSWSYAPQNITYNYTAPGGTAASLRLRYNTFVREPLSRDLFGQTGNPYGRTRHYHCYVNGQYWGVYMTQERPEASFGQTYLGGDKDNYDTIKSAGGSGGYNTEATDGDFALGTSGAPGSPWAKLWWRTSEMRNPGGLTEAQRRTAYFELMGLDPNGAPYNDSVAHPVVLDDDNLIDYMLVTWYCGSFDAPMSTFVGASNNWFGIRDRLGSRGFVYFPHDFEHGMGADLQTGEPDRSTDRTGPWGGTGTNYKGQGMYGNIALYEKSNPAYFHEHLASCLEYRVKLWDNAHRHLVRPGGVLTTANVNAAVDARANVVRTAILGESARWGDAQGVASTDFLPAPWDESITQLKGWVTHGSNAEYIASIPTQANPAGTPGAGRSARLVAQLRAYQDKVNLSDGSNTALPLFSPLNAPTLSNYGGTVATGSGLTITNPNAGTTLYWSRDGTDPRAIGGAVSSSGSVQTGASPAVVTLSSTGRVMTRAYNSGTQTWSALEYADFIVGTSASPSNLVITEINYNPIPGAPGTATAGDEESFEFIELRNVSGTQIDLTDVKFSSGITYTFPTGRTLGAGQYIVVVRDIAAFQSRYPDGSYPGLSAKTVGPWTGALNNDGETLTILDHNDNDITTFAYDDNVPWPKGADGNGATAVFTTANPTTATTGDGNNWLAHGTTHGNPGGPDVTGYGPFSSGFGVSANGLGDGDFDSLLDAFEYLTGGNPVSGSDTARLPIGGRQSFTVNAATNDYLTLTFTRAGGTGDIGIVCETNNDVRLPANWTSNAVLMSRTYNLNGSETYHFRHPIPIKDQTTQFMRIKATIP